MVMEDWPKDKRRERRGGGREDGNRWRHSSRRHNRVAYFGAHTSGFERKFLQDYLKSSKKK